MLYSHSSAVGKKHAHIILIVAILWFGFSAAYAQRYPFTNYTTVNGLSHNRCHAIKQDGRGFIWIGTDIGINRFDGRSFKHYPCPAMPYRSSRYATRYKDAVLFFIDYYGLAICSGDSVKFLPIKGIEPGTINGGTILTDSTYLVNNFPTGLLILNKSGYAKKVLLPAPVKNEQNFVDMFQDSDGVIWLMTTEGLVIFSKKDILHPIMPSFYDKVYINAIKEDKQGNIYTITHKGIHKYSRRQRRHLLTATPETVFKETKYELTSMAIDTEGTVWTCASSGGLIKIGKDGWAEKIITNQNGLASSNTWDVYIDKESNLWVATENGASKLTTTNFISFNFNEAEYQYIKTGARWNDSEFVFSNYVDLYKYKNGAIAPVNYVKNTFNTSEEVIQKAYDGKLWVRKSFSLPNGQAILQTISYDIVNDKLHNAQLLKDKKNGPQYVSMFAVTNDGKSMWFKSDKGLQLYTNSTFYIHPRLMYDADTVVITGMLQDTARSVLWVMNKSKDLLKYKIVASKETSMPYSLQPVEQISSEQLYSVLYERMFVDSRGWVWLCSKQRGVTLIEPTANDTVVNIWKLKSSTFSSNFINDISEDKYGILWVSTSAGLDKVKIKNKRLIVEKDLYGSELCGKFIFFAKPVDNKLFVGSTGCLGVIRLDKEETVSAPDIYISSIKVNDIVRAYGDDKIIPEFSPDSNTLSFTFTGVNFKDEKRIKYSYMLEGVDKYWSMPSEEYNITYSLLSPGRYVFKVKAISANGIWSVQPARFTFIILRPFYTQWWFVLLGVLFIAAIVYSIYRYRINQVLAIGRIRQTISKDLHDDIGATISSISILANMAKSDFVSDNKRNQFLETIQEESKHVSESLSDIVWSINPNNDSLEIMLARMQRYASELFEAKEIAYDFMLPQSVSEMTMEMDKRQHVYLIFKEAVNNLVKYSEAKQAEVKIEVTKKTFNMIISDNGKGFDVDAERSGNGIYNMKKRAETIDAEFKINTDYGKGTTISFLMSL